MNKSLAQDSLIGGVAAELPSSIPVFERHGIDFCCGGTRTLQEAAEKADVDLEGLLAELSGLERQPDERDWTEAPLDELIDFILERHHVFTKQAIQDLGPLFQKVVQAHGRQHPELKNLARMAEALCMELQLHMRKEEEVLFPTIRRLVQSNGREDDPGTSPIPSCGAHAPMLVMEQEHEQAGEVLRRIRKAASDYTLPSDACSAYAALYRALQDLEADLHRHIHLENNVLHPRTRDLLAL